MSDLKITSSAFEHNSKIPSKYTCDGDDINPPLQISGVDENAKSLVLIMDDPDASVGNWDHWIVFNLNPDLTKIKEGVEPDGIKGINSWGKTGYGGSCPGSGEHRYFFKFYSLDIKLDLKEGSSKDKILKSMEEHILQQTELVGLYERK